MVDNEEGGVRRRGRPPILLSERCKAYGVSLTPKEAHFIKEIGAGSLSAGVKQLLRAYTSD